MGRSVLPSSEAIEDYYKYNGAINAVMFDGQFAGKPLYLDIEGPICAAIAAKLGMPPADFISGLGVAVHETLMWRQAEIFHWYAAAAAEWVKSGRGTPPPFSALLCALSVAAERMRRDNQFEAHNYYQRLFNYLQIESETLQHKIKFAFKGTPAFWEELNRWLLDKEGELGRPTAQQINGFKYVSYAISQALIRDAEKQNLHEMFAHFCFAPGEKRMPSEMEVYLDQWIGARRGYGSLIRLWKSEELHERVASAACDELEVWDGAEAGGAKDGVQTYTPTWVCDIETFPPPDALYLSLTLPEGTGEKCGQLPAQNFVDLKGERILKGSAGSFSFEPGGDDGLSELMPASKINAGTLLRDTFEVLNSSGTVRLRKAAGALIPFVRTGTSGRYREVSRVSLLQPHLILCHQGWQARVAKYLQEAARPGFKPHTQTTLRHLPADWAAFTDVEIVRLIAAPDDLLPLIPLAETSLELQRGLRLIEDVWHRGAAPEALAASTEGPLKLQYEAHMGADMEVLAEADAEDSCVQLDLREGAARSKPAALHSVSVYHNGKKLKSRSAVMSSADTPRSIGVLNVPPLCFRVQAGYGPGLLSAEPANQAGTEGVTLSGYTLKGTPPQESGPADGIADGASIPSFESDEPFHRPTFGAEVSLEGSETCVIRGHHYWRVQSHEAHQKRWEAKWAECTSCHKRYVARNRGKKAKPVAAVVRKVAPRPPPPIPQLSETRPCLNTVFDALCYLGGGKYQRFAEICSQASDEPYFVSRVTANLSALGHVDIQTANVFGSPAVWRLAEPAVVELPYGKCVLSGFRSGEMLARLSAALEEFGSKIEKIDQHGGPAAYVIAEDILPVLPDLLSSIPDTHGRPILFMPNPAAGIARAAPSVSTILEMLPETYIRAGEPAERFDPQTGWQPCDNTVAPGAYRSTGGRRIYAFKSPDGPLRQGTYRLVKIAAARQAGQRIHGYDAGKREFISSLGCEPPPLFERALVSCSGLLPRLSGGRITYTGVGPEVAGPILQKLYG